MDHPVLCYERREQENESVLNPESLQEKQMPFILFIRRETGIPVALGNQASVDASSLQWAWLGDHGLGFWSGAPRPDGRRVQPQVSCTSAHIQTMVIVGMRDSKEARTWTLLLSHVDTCVHFLVLPLAVGVFLGNSLKPFWVSFSSLIK